MTMTFLTAQQEVGAQCGLDYTDIQQGPLIKRWINTAQKYIYSQAPWEFLRASNPLVVQTVTDITTGTVTTISGSAAGTFSVAPSVSVQGRYIQTQSSLDWYNITSHTAGQTFFTVEAPFISNLTAGTFTVRKFYYSTSALLDRILQINNSIAPFHLKERSKEYFDSKYIYQTQTGLPLVYMMCGLDSSGLWQFKLWPSPSTVQNLYIDYLQVGVDLVNDSDVSLIPEKWFRAGVIEGACWQGFHFLDDSRAQAKSLEDFMETIIERMMDEMFPSTNLHRVLNSIDDSSLINEFPLPPTYPNV